MNGIILNIVAYCFMSLGAFFALDFSIKFGNRFTRFINFCFMAWNMFMVVYFIKEYDSILASPLNQRLNFFESTTNILIAVWLLSFKLTMKKNK